MPVRRLDVRMRLDERRQPRDQRPVRVVRQPRPAEDRQTVAAVDVPAPQLDAEGDSLLAPRQVHKARLGNAALAAIARKLDLDSLVCDLPDVMVLEVLRLDTAPLLLCEGVNDLAPGALLRLPCRILLVLAGR